MNKKTSAKIINQKGNYNCAWETKATQSIQKSDLRPTFRTYSNEVSLYFEKVFYR